MQGENTYRFSGLTMTRDKTLQPLVSCIMPTFNRRWFIPLSIRYFQRQDYENKELIIIDDGTDSVKDMIPDDLCIRYFQLESKRTVGAKRNLACEKARGEIIAHWDDDDWMAHWRLSYQVDNLLEAGAEICGLDRIFFYNRDTKESWQYIYPKNDRPWVAGGTLCYKKIYWKRNLFPHIDSGEDSKFVWGNRSRMVKLQDSSFYVAMIHPENTSPKRTTDSRWQSYPTSEIRKMIGNDWIYYENDFQKLKKCGVVDRTEKESIRTTLNECPLVSCILPTYNRRHYLPKALEYFNRQDYPNRELVVVDDGTEPADDLWDEDTRIHYIKLPQKHSLGAKRNIACSASKGEIIIFWDDDDWYSSKRITYQVEPILKGQANVTGLGKGLMLCTKTRTFWTTTDRLHEKMFFQGIISGTMAFWKRFWNEGARFPNVSLADDVSFLKALAHRGIRLEKLENTNMFIYVRHDDNTWKFAMGEFLDKNGWQKVEPPTFMCKDDFEFYGIHRKIGSEQLSTSKRYKPKEDLPTIKKPLVSCILSTSNRQPFLKQAIKYFLRQSYDNKELVIVDDGATSCEEFLPDDNRIRYIKIDSPKPLGSKLNIGIKSSNGQIIQKLDDDDYYHQEFLKTTVSKLLGQDPVCSIVGFDCFLVLIAATGELKFSGNGWCAGGTLCFYRNLWEKRPFRDVPKAVDWWFLKDHSPQRFKIQDPGFYILLRHNAGQLWTKMGKLDVTEYFHNRPNYSKTLRDILSKEDLLFYEGLSQIPHKAKSGDVGGSGHGK